MAEITVDVLEKRFDTKDWQTCQNGKVFKIESLSRNDLMQLACEGMQAMEAMSRLLGKANEMVEDWRDGRVFPDPEPIVEIAQQCRDAADGIDLLLDSSPVTNKAQADLRKVADNLQKAA